MQLDVWSDIACPWCYVGKRRLDAALEAYDGEVTLRWRSFELDPNAPVLPDGTAPERLAAKYGTTPDEATNRMHQLEKLAAQDGLQLDLTNATGGNTFDAHRLLHLAREHGLDTELQERLFRAYHAERAPIADHAVLRAICTEVGLPDDEVVATLESDRFADEVRDDELLAAQLKISAVPCFIVDRERGTIGAQPVEELLALLDG